jgi:hypothetical protein
MRSGFQKHPLKKSVSTLERRVDAVADEGRDTTAQGQMSLPLPEHPQRLLRV